MLGYTTLWFIINYNTYVRLIHFSDIHISQGSVATSLKTGFNEFPLFKTKHIKG